MRKRDITLTDVALADLLRDLNVRAVDGAEQQAAVEAELHVRRARRLRARGGDVLRDVRRGDEHLRERDRVVGQEEERQQVLGVRVLVDDTRDVDDEANGQLGNVVCKVARALGWSLR